MVRCKQKGAYQIGRKQQAVGRLEKGCLLAAWKRDVYILEDLNDKTSEKKLSD